MIPQDSKIIAVDFDGTIAEDRYPGIGKPMPFAFETLKMLQGDGHRLILWTYRTGKKLNEAVEFCREHGIEFYAVNKGFPEEDMQHPDTGRKIHADLFIDDRNFGGFPGWGVIYQKLSPENRKIELEEKQKRRRGFFGRRR
ncbi:MAG: Uncharacterised protein [Flavobacteriia bacterium]|nr:MAG: Uncharacterised protein [Flavobacteriia bacterium]